MRPGIIATQCRVFYTVYYTEADPLRPNMSTDSLMHLPIKTVRHLMHVEPYILLHGANLVIWGIKNFWPFIILVHPD